MSRLRSAESFDCMAYFFFQRLVHCQKYTVQNSFTQIAGYCDVIQGSTVNEGKSSGCDSNNVAINIVNVPHAGLWTYPQKRSQMMYRVRIPRDMISLSVPLRSVWCDDNKGLHI